MKRKIISFTIIAILVVLALSGCSGSKTTTTTSPAATTPTATLTKTTAAPTTTQVPSGTSTPTTSTTSASPLPTPTTSKPPTSSTTTPPPTSATTPAGKVLNIAPKSPIKSAHPDSVKTMCLFCHAAGAGALEYPVAPNWNGSAGTPGPWVVEKGSPADHTGRTDPATCLQAGCHVIA
jgi:hypothetical protein